MRYLRNSPSIFLGKVRISILVLPLILVKGAKAAKPAFLPSAR